jgi:uncharacterized membrane protein YfcA
MVEFPISGVETYWWLPALVAFCISSLTSTGGITGAFIIMPFQVSILGYGSPAASPTNMIYNVVAIPTAVWKQHKNRRMLWSLAWATGLGTLPGVAVGAVIRLKYLPDPRGFKLFAGFVLLYLGAKLVYDIINKRRKNHSQAKPKDFTVISRGFSLKHIAFEFDGVEYRVPTLSTILVSLIVGVIGGIYGIGGGAILSPWFVAIYHLPVYAIAGAMLLGTFITSAAGVLIYIIISPLVNESGTFLQPDWLLGFSFGVGGAAGMYVGAWLQHFAPATAIKVILIIGLWFIAGRYIVGYFV